MLFTTHIAVGSVLGQLIGRPVPAGIAGPVSHLVLDAIPHWGGSSERVFWAVAVADGLAGAALTTWLALRAYRSGSRADLAALVGGVTAGAPDWDKPAVLLAGFEPWPAPFNDLHRSIQRESAEALVRELVVGAAAVAASVGALSAIRRARPRLNAT